MNKAFKCTVCGKEKMGKHTARCRECYNTCVTRNLCEKCWWDRTCAGCGVELPYAEGGGDDLQMCDTCNKRTLDSYN